ncbi:MAG: T9SS type A sorting domain-containing protein [Flavobacteriales bacterium]|nr:T9SS type A sorting domain-containing protein [Flavobacteriales bacterium]MCB9168359.1 T9SS type A sorting domain-containing protein [Flavobacteriales bacterium]
MQRPLHLFLLVLLGIGVFPVQAQIAFGGRPYGPIGAKLGWGAPATLELPPIDVPALMAEDAERAASGLKGPDRFGYVHDVRAALEDRGTWTQLPNGDRTWRLVVHCPGAIGIGLAFDTYVVPDGARLFVYNDMGEVRGGFTAASNPGFQALGVAPIPGDRITIEYDEPAAVAGQGVIELTQVTHAYRDPFGLLKNFGDSGPCNVNTICPEGDDWRKEIRSVALMILNGGTCSGSLLNNCAQDSTPYFLSANHCVGSGNPATWVYRFLWESPDCTPTAQGPTNFTVSGSTLLVNNSGSDVALLELSSRPPQNFQPYYAGWDKSGATPQTETCIHHPSGDIKKISHNYDPAGQINIDVGNGPADCWHIPAWDVGTTEPGSSGSGLWNENHHIIGQLYGGQASCSNNVNDYFGRFDVSWPLLEPYLGQCGDTLPGLDPFNTNNPQSFDAAVTAIFDLSEYICDEGEIEPYITLKNNGLTTLTSIEVDYDIDGGPVATVTWNGSLASGLTANFDLPAIPITNGHHTLNVRCHDPNGTNDQNTANDARSKEFWAAFPAQTITLMLQTDEYGSETDWELTDDLGNMLYAGGPYVDHAGGSAIEVDFCLGDGCYIFTINDFAQDGICCDYGDGHYTISDSTGMVLVNSNGIFTDQESYTFCLVGTSIHGPTDAYDVQVFPNPSSGTITARYPAPGADGRLRVTDLSGRTLYAGELAKGSRECVLDLGRWNSGIYLVEVAGEAGRSVTKLALHR